MPLPQEALDVLCKPMAIRPPDLCAIFPGGVEICAALEGQPPSVYDLAMAGLNQAGAAMAPLKPIFTIIEVILAIKDCIDAIPDAIEELSPRPIIKCSEKLAKVIQDLLKLIPQLSLPFLIGSLLDYVIAMIQGVLDELVAIARMLERIATAKLVPSAGLLELVFCAEESATTGIQNLMAAFGAVNSIVALLNELGEPLGIEIKGFPLGEGLGDDVQELLSPLQDALDQVKVARALLPGEAWDLGISGAVADAV